MTDLPRCGFCKKPIPDARRSLRRYCTPKHRVYDWRKRRRAERDARRTPVA